MPAGALPMLVPELDVTNLEISRRFYADLGFHVVYERPHERFAYLACEGAELMLEEVAGPGRRFRTAPIERPFGRGVNFQLEVTDVDAIYERILAAGHEVLVTIEERWYEVGTRAVEASSSEAHPVEAGNVQFVVADPDGYLWRPFRDLGERPSNASARD